MTTLKNLKEQKYKNHPSQIEKPGYWDHVFKVKKPKTAANLEAQIEEFTDKSGGICTIIYSGGHQIVKKSDSQFLGMKTTVVKQSYRPGTTRSGTSDLIITYGFYSFYCEVKFSKSDRLSESQLKFQSLVKKTGGIYIVVSTLQEFEIYFNKFKKSINSHKKQIKDEKINK